MARSSMRPTGSPAPNCRTSFRERETTTQNVSTFQHSNVETAIPADSSAHIPNGSGAQQLGLDRPPASRSRRLHDAGHPREGPAPCSQGRTRLGRNRYGDVIGRQTGDESLVERRGIEVCSAERGVDLGYPCFRAQDFVDENAVENPLGEVDARRYHVSPWTARDIFNPVRQLRPSDPRRATDPRNPAGAADQQGEGQACLGLRCATRDDGAA
jgi:hypothetical protein